jgi:hypothetical protein
MLHKPVFFFQRHVASLQSRVFKNTALRILATIIFPEILSGKSCGLTFLQEFRLYRHSNCLVFGKSGYANLAHACIFFPEAFRITENRFPRRHRNAKVPPRQKKHLQEKDIFNPGSAIKITTVRGISVAKVLAELSSLFFLIKSRLKAGMRPFVSLIPSPSPIRRREPCRSSSLITISPLMLLPSGTARTN